jgi:hypothetical protein
VFDRGYVDLVKKDFFGTAKKKIADFNLIDRIYVFFKSADTTIPFSEEEKVWVDRTAATKTPDDVLDLAEELYAWMDENTPETDTHEDGMPMVGGESGEGETADTSDGDGESEDGPQGSASGVPSDEKTDGEDKGSSSGDGESDEENADEESDSPSPEDEPLSSPSVFSSLGTPEAEPSGPSSDSPSPSEVSAVSPSPDSPPTIGIPSS